MSYTTLYQRLRTLPLIAVLGTWLASLPAAWAQMPTQVPAQAPSSPTAGQNAAKPAELPGGLRFVTSLEGVEEYLLPNGMKLLLYPEASKPLVSVNMTVMVGSRHENTGQGGMAHLLEHMLFRGSPKAANPKNELTTRGMRWNATTTTDRTNYFAYFTADATNTTWYIQWLADVLVNASIAPSSLASEMTVVRNELEIQNNDPSLTANKRLNSLMYPTHAYGRAVVGTAAELENMKAADLRAFYKAYYRPDNAVLIVTGSFDKATVLRDVVQSFGAITKPATPIPQIRSYETVQEGEQTSVVRKAGSAQLALVGYRAVPAGHPDHLALNLGATALGLIPSGRIQQAIVDKGLGSRIFASFMPMRESGQLVFGALGDGKTTPTQLQQAIVQVVEGLAIQPITEAEIQRARDAMRSANNISLTDSRTVAQVLSETSALGDWRFAFWSQQRSDAITAAQVQAALTKYLLRSNRVSVLYEPGEQTRAPLAIGSPFDNPAQAAPLLADLASLKTENAGVAVAALDTNPVALEKKVIRKNFSPNIRAAMLPKPTKGNLVQVRVRLNFGDAKTAANNIVLSRAMGDLMLNGTRTQSWSQIQDRLVQLQSVMSVGSDTTAVVASLIAPRAQLPQAMQAMQDVLRNANFPADRVEQFKRERITVLNEEANDPGSVTLRELLRHDQPYKPNDARYRLSVKEEIEQVRALTPERLRQYHQSMVSARTMQIAVVGDFDAPAFEQNIMRLFGDWNTGPAFKRIEEPPYAYRPIVIRTKLKDKTNAVIKGGIDVPLSKKMPELAAFEIAAQLIGGEFFGELRERSGLSYSTNANLAASPLDPLSTVWFEASVPAAKADQALKQMQRILQRIPELTFNEAIVSQVAQELVKRAKIARSDDGNIANLLADQLENGGTMRELEAYEDRLLRITSDEIKDLWKKHIREDRYVWAIAGDLP